MNEMHSSTTSIEKRWLNRNVVLFGLTSFFSDFCHEMATAVLPQFMQVIGLSAASLGFIEGSADALSSFVKLGAGYHSDRIGHRKAWTVAGYVLTAVAKALFAFAFAWPLIMIGRLIGWLGRGIRGPLRDAMLADSVSADDRGKAFGFHRAGDTLGAVVGPLTAFWLITIAASRPDTMKALISWIPHLTGSAGWQFRTIFLLTLVPGLLSVILIAMTREKARSPNDDLRLWRTLKALPIDFRRFLLAVAVFGMADFAPTLLILRAETALEPQMGVWEASRVAALLYMFRNVVYAAAAFPIGAMSRHFSRSRYLAVGYGVAVVTFLGFAFSVQAVWWFVIMFGLAGVFIAWEDTIEGVAVRDYVSADIAGTAFGALGVANGIGDFVSSFGVGILWAVAGPAVAFGFAAIVGSIGVALMAMTPARGGKDLELNS